ncbi:MAG: hypothetical protein A2X87_00505 [Deltaproteobacteria bacterium GWC2_42_51]|nr:MAG: hypothetical protein A2056_01475 [Deltaproteobacteria bacterium GWA2_42_85]OGP31884.1 MAG: hypothetical protein A2X87_00505 [Deltaproteobacteria bacterium GWC2_42_51]OGP43440.1 MAG: hypothetical protein A2090_10675 [Deltaproteobacteria bacterium GWD2_42_10]OGP46301.1 MAG: hypothetical protein A2022_11135 [Deltaproteobacteria bacterium GWF2_42_12]OGQ30413.1 MAG: hypothetical protein A3D29_05610 [Deltaproteobacteria bacterium RIFCSPHIGHO2_02_FULL_42_44]OGQ35747.1 MAG: hypothetical protei
MANPLFYIYVHFLANFRLTYAESQGNVCHRKIAIENLPKNQCLFLGCQDWPRYFSNILLAKLMIMQYKKKMKRGI